ncbi:MAG: DsrE family protein [Firmicutes bacterium]|nr:DsrE family protein [Bacillota bacterium]
MNSKKILIIMKETPFSGGDVTERLRFALGVTAGYYEHKADLFLVEDAVYLLKISGQSGEASRYLNSFKLNGFSIYVDLDSIRERKIDEKLIEAPFVKLERQKLPELMEQSDVVFSL